jgi:outer membrane receptor protein involved in Fe transport
MTRKFLLVCTIAVFSLGGACYAQSNGAISGVVQDASGSVVPGAQIQITNELTGLRWDTESDPAGRFNVSRLPIGEYNLRATKTGFKQFSTERFRLDADQQRSVEVSLSVGTAAEAITVTGSVSQVETVGGTLRQVVDEKRITELPLNGRNPVQLVLLIPGAVPAPAAIGVGSNAGIAVNGARGTSTNYMLDGGDNNDPQEGVSAVTPNPDALEEFSVLTNNFSAEYGRNAGAIVNAVTKSGTNRLHGSLYEFVRNDAFDARNFFAVSKGKLRRNQFGGSLGGPMIRNKAFFFASYEGVRERQGQTFSSLVVPTERERGGDFSESALKPRDPLTNQPFASGIIPQDRFDPAALKFLSLLQVPLPNSSGNRYIFNRPQNLDSNQFLGRGDYSISQSQRLTGRAFKTSSKELNTAGLPVLQSGVGFDTWNVSGQHTSTFTPALLGVGQYTWNKSELDRGPLPVGGGDGVSFQDLGIRVNRAGEDALGKTLVPQYRGQVNGYWNLNQDNLVVIDRGTHQTSYAITYSRGAHLLKIGGEYRFTKSDRVTANQVDPQFTFNGQITGNPFADFLMGRPFNMTQGSVRVNRIRSQAYNLYFQDEWRVHRDLSFTLGLRYEPFNPYYSADDELTVFRPGRQSTMFPSAPAGLLYVGDEGVPRGGADADLNNLAPRVSFAWSPFGSRKTSIRAAYGIFYDVLGFHRMSHFVNSPPYSLQVTVNTPQSLSDPYGGQENPFPYAPPSTSKERAAYQFFRPVTVGLSVNPDQAAPYVQQWNLNVQRELARDYMLTVAYVGTKGTRLPIRNELNPAVFRPGATAGNTNARRIYAPNYASIIDYQTVINSTYNALQTTLNKRLSNGFTLLASYTFSKSIDGGSLEADNFNGQNPLNLAADKGLSDFDIRQRFVASFLYEVPGPKSGWGRWVLGGWQTNGIFSAQTGSPFTVVSGQDRALAGTGAQRADLVGIPHLEGSRSRSEQTAMYFDPSAFALPALGTYGNAGRNQMIGPGRWNLDLALFKGFTIREDMKVNFRWEMFNALNHANMNNPRNNISAANAGRIDSTSDPRIMQFGLRLAF